MQASLFNTELHNLKACTASLSAFGSQGYSQTQRTTHEKAPDITAPVQIPPAVQPHVTHLQMDFTNPHALSILLPTLSWHSHHNEQRWITWLAAEFLERSTLENYDVDLSCLRMLVDSSQEHSPWRLLLTALRNGSSTLVVANLPTLNAEQLFELNHAAHSGNSQALILTTP